jgi:hypothetical protein
MEIASLLWLDNPLKSQGRMETPSKIEKVDNQTWKILSLILLEKTAI